MERRWLTSVLATIALSAAPVLAEEAAPEAEKPPVPEIRAAQSSAGEPAPSERPADTEPCDEEDAPETGMPGEEAAPGEKVASNEVLAQGQPAPPPTPPVETEKQPEEPAWATWGGSADFYFSTNFNDPFTGLNALRAFDIEDEKGPHLGLIDLWGQIRRNPVGFRVDVDFGPTSHLVNAFEPSGSTFWEHVQQLYISANLNKKGNFYVDFGKWVTPAGAEVIEPRDNWLYTRGLLFTWAIPFYHFGTRVYYYTSDTDYYMVHLTRGWNAVGDPDHGPGFGISASKALNPKWTLIGNYIGGEEAIGSDESMRHLVDIVALYNASAKWAYTFNVDYATQSDFTWYGLSAQAKYQMSAKSYLAGRVEWLRDADGGLFGEEADALSVTLGYTRVINKHLQGRVEYRHDFSGGADLFPEDRPKVFGGDQGTFLISAILGI
jgi:hypothetical protein